MKENEKDKEDSKKSKNENAQRARVIPKDMPKLKDTKKHDTNGTNKQLERARIANARARTARTARTAERTAERTTNAAQLAKPTNNAKKSRQDILLKRERF